MERQAVDSFYQMRMPFVKAINERVYLHYPESMRYHAGGVLTSRVHRKLLKYPVPHGRPVDLALNELQLIN